MLVVFTKFDCYNVIKFLWQDNYERDKDFRITEYYHETRGLEITTRDLINFAAYIFDTQAYL